MLIFRNRYQPRLLIAYLRFFDIFLNRSMQDRQYVYISMV